MLKICVLVSGGGTNLQALIDACGRGEINGEIVSVVSSRKDAYALVRAQKAGINTTVIEKSDEMDTLLLKHMLGLHIDLIVLAGFTCIVGSKLTEKYRNKIVNVHPSLIPSFCGEGFYGINVHRKALEYGVKVSGATVHFVNEEVDGGAIIMQKAVCVKDDDTPQSLQERIMQEAERIILPKAVSLICRGCVEVSGRNVKIKNTEPNS